MSKEEFNNLWEDSTKEQILNQYYYDYEYCELLKSIIKEVREYIGQCTRIIHNERTGTFENDVYMKEQDLKEFLEILDKENK